MIKGKQIKKKERGKKKKENKEREGNKERNGWECKVPNKIIIPSA